MSDREWAPGLYHLEDLAPDTTGLYCADVRVVFHYDEQGRETYRDWTWLGRLWTADPRSGDWVERHPAPGAPLAMPRGLAACIHSRVAEMIGTRGMRAKE